MRALGATGAAATLPADLVHWDSTIPGRVFRVGALTCAANREASATELFLIIKNNLLSSLRNLLEMEPGDDDAWPLSGLWTASQLSRSRHERFSLKTCQSIAPS